MRRPCPCSLDEVIEIADVDENATNCATVAGARSWDFHRWETPGLDEIPHGPIADAQVACCGLQVEQPHASELFGSSHSLQRLSGISKAGSRGGVACKALVLKVFASKPPPSWPPKLCSGRIRP